MRQTLNPNLRDFWQTRYFEDGRRVVGRVLHGGRASSKSHDAAGFAIARANFRTERFLCTRMFQNRIADSVYTLLCDKIRAFGLENRFRIYADAIEHLDNDSIFRFYGLARNLDEVKSFEGATVWWNEESHNLTKEMFQTVGPTVIRNEGYEMWFTFNPKLVTDYSYNRLVVSPPAGFLVRQINYPDNPFLNEGALQAIQDEFEEDRELAEHIYLGVPLSSDGLSFIKYAWIEAAVDAHIKLDVDMTGPTNVGYDVADDGQDRCCAIKFDGGIAIDLDSWKAKEDELDASAMRAWRMRGNGVFAYDCIGVGAGVGSTLKTAGFTSGYSKFHAGSAPKDPHLEYSDNVLNGDKFENRKAQAWTSVADRFRNTYNAVTRGMKYEPHELISISSDLPMLDQLKGELAMPHRVTSERGKDMVEKKKAMKTRLKTDVSPDLADSFIMGACPHLVEESVQEPQLIVGH